jgi:hypothetical protein
MGTGSPNLVPGKELPLARRLDGFCVQAETLIQRADNSDIRDPAVRPHDGGEPDDALDRPP